ncbi:hypothetical protein [Methylobacterium frigidaeris]|uniref:Lipoprotein n=1 Tax=Methylobacterium frigidaeris TaxID=2038277 RepID=A0AA37H653_9HYPH|nr:hypothetical protein [Methylobacterium frigidaeris]PIK73301.1 hypothetical protein CS379_09170 [Methylobacterium frigidaeris]GJD60222.1 hypothetical protein MPEAHAMD_0357 [Methylobacterium frigidaeris]
MRLLAAPLAALLMVGCVVPASARCPLYLPMRVGPATGNPEKDTVGLFCAQPEAALATAPAGGSRSPVRVGAPMGDAEKDTMGFAPSSSTEQAAR